MHSWKKALSLYQLESVLRLHSEMPSNTRIYKYAHVQRMRSHCNRAICRLHPMAEYGQAITIAASQPIQVGPKQRAELSICVLIMLNDLMDLARFELNPVDVSNNAADCIY